MKKLLFLAPCLGLGLVLAGCGAQEDADTLNAAPPPSANAVPIPTRAGTKGKVTMGRPSDKAD